LLTRVTMTEPRTRRDFLRGIPAADSVVEAIGNAFSGGESGCSVDHSYLLRIGRRAMACEFEICLPASPQGPDTEPALEALDLVEALEEQLSYFRPGSEISRINRLAAQAPVEVEPRLFALLELAVQVYRETAGAFDLTATPLWEAWGFSRRAGALPTEQQLAEARACVGSHLVELNAEERTVRFLKEGVRLSLGSIGKGYTLDRCAEKLSAAGVHDFLLHGGYSSVLGRGHPVVVEGSLPSGALPVWTVGIRDPLHPNRRLAEIRLAERALSTSSSSAQSFRHQGRRYGHILDPRTGWPAEGVVSATAVAPSAALAEALSTAFYVMGPQATLDYCRQRPEIAAVLVCSAGPTDRTELCSVGFEGEDLRFFGA
jgi:FAD:protein FMN transferase